MIRSLLFVPGNSERKMERALSSGADALILDLEDSVAAAQKEMARGLVAEFLKAQSGARKQLLLVRVNPMSAGAFDSDLKSVLAGRPDGIMLPKSEPAQVRSLSSQLNDLEKANQLGAGSTAIFCIATETPQAVFALGSYAGTSKRLRGLAWGAEDLAAVLGAANKIDGRYDDVFRLARALCLLGAAAAGVDAFDAVYVDYKNGAGLASECTAARQSGFAGKLAIHPDQVPIINQTFSVTDAEAAWSRKVIAAFDANPDLGAIGIDGKMVDRPHYILAQRTLSRLS
jgi:citrate lyase subunit beta/citryl-CoA lyase